MNSHVVIFSHGFGVTKESRGFFTEIATALPDAHAVLFDYNKVDRANNTMELTPFSEQAELLQAKVAQTRAEHPEAVIDIIAHSQGCWIAALAKISGIRKTILLAPPERVDFEQTLERYRGKEGAVIDLEGTTVFPRSDGSQTYIPAQYWKERAALPPAVELFNTLPNITDVTLIKANQDTVVGDTPFNGLDERITVLALDGDHEFGKGGRDGLIACVQKVLAV